MPNSLQSSAIASPASRRATNCSLSSIAEHSFQGITPSPFRRKVPPMCPVQCVTYVSGRSLKELEANGVMGSQNSNPQSNPHLLYDCRPPYGGQEFALRR